MFFSCLTQEEISLPVGTAGVLAPLLEEENLVLIPQVWGK